MVKAGFRKRRKHASPEGPAAARQSLAHAPKRLLL
jgi:hypothetical protein